MKSRPYNDESVILIDDIMPHGFDPFTVCLAYREGKEQNVCIASEQDNQIIDEIMGYTQGSWWVPSDSRRLKNLIYNLSMRGIGLVIYTSKEAMKDYHKEIEP